MHLIRAIPIGALFLFTALYSTAETPRLTLEQNLQNGSQLQLSDGSIYEIAPTDKAKTTFWLTPIAITVSQSTDPQFPVLLTNTLTGVSVRAKQVRPATPPSQTSPKL